MLALLRDTLFVFSDILKYSSRFIFSCLFSVNSLVCYVARYSLCVTGHAHMCHMRVGISLCAVNIFWVIVR
jgi:hypothetical protein